MSEQTAKTFDQWAILELMGHVLLAGRITEEEHFGSKVGRIDIPNGDGFTTQFFGGGSVYRLTPTTEEIARKVAAGSQPVPVSLWESPAPAYHGCGNEDCDCEDAGGDGWEDHE